MAYSKPQIKAFATQVANHLTHEEKTHRKIINILIERLTSQTLANPRAKEFKLNSNILRKSPQYFTLIDILLRANITFPKNHHFTLSHDGTVRININGNRTLVYPRKPNHRQEKFYSMPLEDAAEVAKDSREELQSSLRTPSADTEIEEYLKEEFGSMCLDAESVAEADDAFSDRVTERSEKDSRKELRSSYSSASDAEIEEYSEEEFGSMPLNAESAADADDAFSDRAMPSDTEIEEESEENVENDPVLFLYHLRKSEGRLTRTHDTTPRLSAVTDDPPRSKQRKRINNIRQHY